MNNELKLILATHLAFYRRHPWLMALFFLGFSLGSALLTAISGLNQEAKSRYRQSSALLENPVSHLVRPPIGQEYISGDIWIALKRMGILHASPVLTGKIKTKAGTTLAVKGVDTLQWFDGTSKPSALSQPVSTEKSISSNSFLTGLLVDKQFKSRLTNKSGQLLLFELDQSLTQPNITFAEDIGFAAIADIAYVDALLDAGGSISYIELSYLKPEDLKRIKQLIAGEAELIESDQQEFDVLSAAFFFNLTALALLGYVVAAFLSFNAIKLTLSARKKILAQMQLLGCTKGAINISLSMELLTVSLITALIGSLGGYVMANGLILDVNRTLVNLYQLEKALTIHWHWHNVTLGLLLNIGALSIILLSQSRLFQTLSRSIYIGLILLVCCAFFWFYLFADTKFDALLLCFTILVFFILLAPKLMEKLVYLPLGFKHPLVNWLYQDTRFHIKDLHIAIVAILVALGSAIGMQIMVNSFSNTLSAHLEKQLSADIYLRSSKLDSELRKQLTLEPEVAQVSIYLQSEGSVDSVPATLASFGPDASHYAHIGLTSGEVVSTSLFAQQGCLVNEQGLIKFGLVENQNISFKQGKRQFSCRIRGFFYDYGNPSLSIITLEEDHSQAKLLQSFFGYSIRLKQRDKLAVFSELLVNKYGQEKTQVMPNQTFKQYAKRLFNDTFMVTKALNGFILAIALLSLCTSLLSLCANQLKQLTILKNLGVTQSQLLVMKLMQTGLVVAFTTLFAIPLGFALGFSLLKFVMPIAFGWTIHFSLDIATLLMTCLTLFVVAVLCAFLPIRKLAKNDGSRE